MTDTLAIVGAGHGAGQLVASLRQHAFPGRIVLIGDEPHLPYQRPPLSKKFLAGELSAERLNFKPPAFYEDPQLELRLDTRVDSIDLDSRRLATANGDKLGFDKLVLATGSRVRRLDIAGAGLPGIHYLRNIADVEAIRSDMANSSSVVIVGAGYIGLEVAAVCRQRGLEVTVIEMADRVMSRVVSANVSDFYQLEHANHGVRLLLATGLAGFEGKRRIKRVLTSDGQKIAADFVVVGVGILPNTELAEAAGIDVDNGIVVDDQCRSSDAGVFAIGDCTSHPNDIYGRRLRLESVHNALEQAKTAASNLCGTPSSYCQVPWFWSDQYDLKLQIAGLSEGHDEVVVRGDPAGRAFSCLYLRNGVLIAIDAINSPRDFMQAKPLIAGHARIDADRLADAGTLLKDLS